MTVTGHCLCGEVAFAIEGDLPNIYQCHCSLCRRVSGSASNAAMRVPAERFRWTGGEDQIGRYATETGFRSDFCRNCGSPVPNETAGGARFWVPAGLLDEPAKSRVALHLYVDSRASWDAIDTGAPHFDTMPDRESLDTILDCALRED